MSPILLVEDDLIMGESICDRFTLESMPFKWAKTARDALTMLKADHFSCMVSDIRLPDLSGEMLYNQARESDLIDYPTIFITGYGTQQQAERLMTLGASDYLLKPLDLEQLIGKINLLTAGQKHTAASSMVPTLGISREIRRLEEMAAKLSTDWTSIMVSGESGAGKEEFARLLHRHAHNEEAPFVTVNCGAIPEALVEAELFGYERGAFTGAAKAHKGFFEQANNGTIFLDEIGELTTSAQVRLLRILQEQVVTRIGGEKSIKLNFRLITATNRDLREEVKAGRFREDLYYRINIIHMRIPPLRERPDDISWLTRLFIHRWNEAHPGSPRMLSEPTLAYLRERPWRGNVRELKHAVERACLLTAHPLLRPTDFEIPDQLIEDYYLDNINASAAEAQPILRLADYNREQEKKYLSHVLRHFNGHVGQAAAALGISRKTLWEKTKKFEIKAIS
ncbi:MAG: sigma-54 dependent transcriptional regulator [Burkholderiales bacterium]|nr:sigma-54 dependent transcriptional regulator [Burkholderiales bacterium]